MESPETKPLAPRPRARISRLGWGLLIAQAILYVTFSGTFYIAGISLAFVLTLLVLFFAAAAVYCWHEINYRFLMRVMHICFACMIGWLVGFPAFAVLDTIFYTDDHKAGETKQNLHSIQLAVERYATDNEGGYYPDYILGGTYEDDYVINEEYYKKAFSSGENPLGGTDTPPPAGKLALPGSGDWAAMEGYMPMYPKNPFRKWNSESSTIPSSPPGPYRKVYVADFKPMVQVAADHRFTGALIGERYWERSENATLKHLLAGNFIYKGLIPPGEKHPRGYILLVFGRASEKGEDALTTIPGGHELDGRLQDGSGVGMGVPVIPELGIKGDGKPDGIILVLTGGWPFEETGEKQQEQ